MCNTETSGYKYICNTKTLGIIIDVRLKILDVNIRNELVFYSIKANSTVDLYILLDLDACLILEGSRLPHSYK